MIPAQFEYHGAQSVEEALDLMEEYGDKAKILAGGHSLLPTMKMRLAQPEHIIDISSIGDLVYIEEKDGKIEVGALATHADIAANQLVRTKVPLLANTAAQIGDVQVRNRGTIGGSVAHADPAADYPAALLALEAEIIVKGKEGERSIPVGEFFQGFFATACGEGELVVALRFSPVSDINRAVYKKVPHPASGYPVVGCAISIEKKENTCQKARIAFTALGGKPFRDEKAEKALEGQALETDTIKNAASQAVADVDASSDNYASGEYRIHLAQVTLRRGLEELAD